MESFVGLFAAVVTTAASIPQVVKCWRTRSSGDLSLRVLVIQMTGLSAWAVYGVMKGDPIIITSNSVGVALFALLAFFKLTFKDKAPEAQLAQ